MVEPFLGGEDFQSHVDAFKEKVTLMGRPVLVKRCIGFTAGDEADGVFPERIDTNLPMLAIVEQVTPDDILQSNGILQIGDIRTSTLADVWEGVGVGISQYGDPNQADHLIFERLENRLVGKPDRIFYGGGRAYTMAAWRRI